MYGRKIFILVSFLKGAWLYFDHNNKKNVSGHFNIITGTLNNRNPMYDYA